jgi:hypothetical protein
MQGFSDEVVAVTTIADPVDETINDLLEDEIGNIDGLEVKLSRPPNSDPNDPAKIVSLVIYRLEKIEIEI